MIIWQAYRSLQASKNFTWTKIKIEIFLHEPYCYLWKLFFHNFLITSCFFSVFQDFAIKVIKDTHTFWKALISKNTNAGELNW